ncbi:hypothetical protein CPC08DRAFT_710816 [Agrocybe pediades]|nr:hypothetical protein CPC08DRAFT_710816 [Agrocybe pediades]
MYADRPATHGFLANTTVLGKTRRVSPAAKEGRRWKKRSGKLQKRYAYLLVSTLNVEQQKRRRGGQSNNPNNSRSVPEDDVGAAC